MHIHIIACRVLTRDLSYYVSQSDNVVDVSWLPQGLHEMPNLLRKEIARVQDEVYAGIRREQLPRVPDYIVLGYGLCSEAIVGIEALDIPIVVPRCDDCLALFLGSQRRYLQYFNEYKGTYWLNCGWIDSSLRYFEDNYKLIYDACLEKYDDEDMAEEMLEVWKEMLANYKNLGYINSEVYQKDTYKERAASYAKEQGWNYLEVDGDSRLLEKLVNGDWSEDEFLVCPPRHRIEATHADDKIRAVSVE